MTHKNIIGFLNFRDFEHELLNSGLDPITLRVQDYKKTEHQPGAFARFNLYYVEIAFAVGDEVRVCRFKVGELGAFDDPTPDQRRATQQAERSSQLARLALNTYFQNRGYRVLPGLIAGSEQSLAIAPLSTLFAVTGPPEEELPFAEAA